MPAAVHDEHVEPLPQHIKGVVFSFRGGHGQQANVAGSQQQWVARRRLDELVAQPRGIAVMLSRRATVLIDALLKRRHLASRPLGLDVEKLLLLGGGFLEALAQGLLRLLLALPFLCIPRLAGLKIDHFLRRHDELHEVVQLIARHWARTDGGAAHGALVLFVEPLVDAAGK